MPLELNLTICLTIIILNFFEFKEIKEKKSIKQKIIKRLFQNNLNFNSVLSEECIFKIKNLSRDIIYYAKRFKNGKKSILYSIHNIFYH